MLQRRQTAMQRFTFSHKWRKPATRSGQIKLVLTVVLLIILLISSLAYSFLVLNQTNSHANSSVSNWQRRAETAWKYFQPDIGVNRATGLTYASADWPEFTERDLSAYILAVINAERLGIVARDSPWGSDIRIEKILSFLENRPLTSNRLPYATYSADTGAVADGEGKQTETSLSNAAFLLLAMNDLRSFRPSLSNRITAIIARCDYDFLGRGSFFSDNDIYSSYLTQGFWAFGFSNPQLIDAKTLGNGSTVFVCGENIPKAWVTTEPLVLAMLQDRADATYKAYGNSVFLAQQNRYNQTGKLTAFGEGLSTAHETLLEYVVTNQGEQWQVYAQDGTSLEEVVFTKIAFAYDAVYGDEYTQALVNYVSSLATEQGFLEGIEENGQTVDELTADTNSIILQAAKFFAFSKPTLQAESPDPAVFPRYAIAAFVLGPDHLDEQFQLLDEIGAYNMTLVTRESDPAKFQLVYNAAKNRSDCIIPEFSFMQSLKTEWREDVINARFQEFQFVSGTYPSGFFSFQVDTYTAIYLKNKYNVTYALGNVWDQVNIDSMSLRGGFDAPYYASKNHNLVPAKTENDSTILIMPPFATAPTDRYHFDNNHLIDLYSHDVDLQEFKYVSLNSPFFTPFFLELDWLINQKDMTLSRMFIENYKWVFQNFNVVTAEQFAQIFESNFPTTPEYHFTYSSSNATVFPETQGWKIEWLFNSDCRVARLNDKVMSVLNYNAQNADPFLTKYQNLSFTGWRFGEDMNNMISTDLSFSIDGLWQIEYGDRTLQQATYVVYTGNLENFTQTHP